MILIDTSVWVDHLRAGDQAVAAALERGRVLMHPFVLGEIACGNLTKKRSEVLRLLAALPAAPAAAAGAWSDQKLTVTRIMSL